MRYRLFRRKSSGLYYFQFLTNNEQPIMNSQGYADKATRNNGLEAVINNSESTGRYDSINNEDGTFSFILKAGNGQEIGRSPAYDTEAARTKAMSLFQKEVPKVGTISAQTLTNSTTTTTERTATKKTYEAEGNTDNYKQLSFYEKNGTEVQDGFDSFSVDGLHYFSYNLGGSVYLISEGYESTGARDNGIKSVTKNMPNEARYQTAAHPNGKYFFNLRAGNHQEIATSRWFDSEENRNTVIARMVAGLGLAGKSTKEGTKLEAANRTATISIAAPPSPKEDKPKKKRKKRTTEKKPKVEKVYLANGTYLFNEITYQIFRSGNNKHYFTFKNKEEKTIFLNADVRGFVTQEEAQLVVDEIMKYGPYEVNYNGKVARNGKFYFYLKGKDDKNLAKSFFYGSEELMQEAVGTLLGSELQIAAAQAAAKKVVDDYLVCSRYKGAPGFHRFKQEEIGEYYFSFNDDNGETILRSEGYTTEAARENGINSVIKNSPLDERWKTGAERDGKFHYFALKAGNHQEIAKSCIYEDEATMLTAFGWVRSENSTIGKGAQLINGLWWTAAGIRVKEEEAAAAATAAAAALALATKQKEEADEAARLKVQEEDRRKKAAAAAAAAAALALAAKQKEEADEAARLKVQEEDRRKKAAAAATAAAAALALAAKKKKEATAAALVIKQKKEAALAAAAITKEEPNKPFLSGMWPWLLALLLLALILWFFRGCFGCGEKAAIIPPPVLSETTEAAVIDTTEIEEKAPAPEPLKALGPNATEMGFAAGTIEARLADCLSDPTCDLGQTFVWQDARYPFSSAKMSRGAMPHVDNIAKLMKAYPNAKINIGGFIDGKESDIYNGPFGDGVITLSGIRARCLYKKLAKRGISKSKMTFEGFGNARPIATNDTKAGRLKNRRTEIRITAR